MGWMMIDSGSVTAKAAYFLCQLVEREPGNHKSRGELGLASSWCVGFNVSSLDLVQKP